MEQFALVLAGAAHIDQFTVNFQMGQNIITEGANRGIIARFGNNIGGWITWHFACHRAPFSHPLGATAVHHLGVVKAKEFEDPEGVGRPPVVLVAIKDDGGVGVNAIGAQDFLKLFFANVVAHGRVIEIDMPVDLDGAGNVAGVVEQNILVALHEADIGILEMVRHPSGADQDFRVGVAFAFDAHKIAPLCVLDRCL